MNDDIVVYEKSTCSKCRLAEEVLRAKGVPFRRVEYYKEPFTHEKLKDLLRKMALPARELVRTGEEVYRTLRLKDKNLSEDELIDIMIKNPNLIQRPIIEKGERAVLARPVENLDRLL